MMDGLDVTGLQGGSSLGRAGAGLDLRADLVVDVVSSEPVFWDRGRGDGRLNV